jgi:uncharacterized membrane protein YecN with MAPEG domain
MRTLPSTSPLTLLLIYLRQTVGTFIWAHHALCLAMLIGRLAQAWGVSHEKEDYRFRVTGMVLTLGVLGGARLRLLIGAVGLTYR